MGSLATDEENDAKNRVKKKHARVAQWLEHWSSKPGVDSSILSSGIEYHFFLPSSKRRTDLFFVAYSESLDRIFMFASMLKENIKPRLGVPSPID